MLPKTVLQPANTGESSNHSVATYQLDNLPLYPHPSIEVLPIATQKRVNVSIINMPENQVFTQENITGSTAMDVSDLSSEICFVFMTHEGNKIPKKADCYINFNKVEISKYIDYNCVVKVFFTPESLNF